MACTDFVSLTFSLHFTLSSGKFCTEICSILAAPSWSSPIDRTASSSANALVVSSPSSGISLLICSVPDPVHYLMVIPPWVVSIRNMRLLAWLWRIYLRYKIPINESIVLVVLSLACRCGLRTVLISNAWATSRNPTESIFLLPWHFLLYGFFIYLIQGRVNFFVTKLMCQVGVLFFSCFLIFLMLLL